MSAETKNNLNTDDIRNSVRWYPPERTADGGWQRRGYPNDSFWQVWQENRAVVTKAGLRVRKDLTGAWFVYEQLTPERARECRAEWEATARQNQRAFVRLERRDLAGMKRRELEPLADGAAFPTFPFPMPERGEPVCVQEWRVGDSIVLFDYLWYFQSDELYASLMEHEQELMAARVRVKKGDRTFGHKLWFQVLVYASGEES